MVHLNNNDTMLHIDLLQHDINEPLEHLIDRLRRTTDIPELMGFADAILHYAERIPWVHEGGARYGTWLTWHELGRTLEISFRSVSPAHYTVNDVALAMAFEEYVLHHLEPQFLRLELGNDTANPIAGMERVAFTVKPLWHNTGEIWDLFHTLYDLNTHAGGLGDWGEAAEIKGTLLTYAELTFLHEWLVSDAPDEARGLTASKMHDALYDILALPSKNKQGWPYWKDWQLQRALKLATGAL